MKPRSMYGYAYWLAGAAVPLAFLLPGQMVGWFTLCALALIMCLGSLIEAVNRCAAALERRN
jgi:hypothetical protein